MSPTLLPHVALALLTAIASRRVPALRPAAVLYGAMACLDAVPSWVVAGLRAARHVAWPGVLVVGAAWVLTARGEAGHPLAGPQKDERPGAEAPDPSQDAPSRVVLDAPEGAVVFPRRRRLTSLAGGLRARAASWLGLHDDEAAVFCHAARLPQALASLYLIASVAVAILYRPGLGVPAALAARVVAGVALVALLTRRAPSAPPGAGWLATRSLPRTWPALAAVLPAAAMAVGVVAGVWPLVQAGGAAVREGWWLARWGTWVAVGVEACVVGLAWRARRSTITP